jgi:hypothetical protein
MRRILKTLAAPLPWDGFARLLLMVAACITAALVLFVVIADPYGARTIPGVAAAPMMDINQRYMYPRVARSRMYDSAVFGTSTVRLLNPERLDALFGARFANLAMNAATPWEQIQLIRLFIRESPAPRLIILGLDSTWCDQKADSSDKLLTFRSFPPWLYDNDKLNDIIPHLSLKSLEIAGRVALNGMGLMPERIRGDGYEVFTPPEDTYDLARAREHIWRHGPLPITPMFPPEWLTEIERSALKFPAVTWAAETIGLLPQEARVLMVFPPVHIREQPVPDTRNAAIESECKGRFAALARNRGGALVDFRMSTDVTRNDENYWDPLHYRQPIAEKFTQALREADIGLASQDGFYRLLTKRPLD